MFLEFLDLLCVEPEPLQWLIPFTESERADQQAFFEKLADKPVVGVVCASANHNKDWPVERYPKLVDALAECFGAHVVLLGGPSEREQTIAQAIVQRARHRPVSALGDSIRRLVWLIDRCNLIIAPDTGPVHIARALDVPVVGLYGHTNPWRVGPYRKYQELWIDKYTDGPPDPSNFDPKSGRMQLITVDEIVEKAACVL
jgi:heptosyltransferase I